MLQFRPSVYTTAHLEDMTFDSFCTYCNQKRGVTEEFPFDANTLVFKVMGKMFALTNIERLPLTINLKCDPEWAIELRETYESVQAGYHMNKKHWNTVVSDDTIPDVELRSFIDHSYDLVVKGLKKADREKLAAL
ncbi:MAG: MmcQ/YjbR family DNA-binding protein [Rhodothermales bacterium]